MSEDLDIGTEYGLTQEFARLVAKKSEIDLPPFINKRKSIDIRACMTNILHTVFSNILELVNPTFDYTNEELEELLQIRLATYDIPFLVLCDFDDINLVNKKATIKSYSEFIVSDVFAYTLVKLAEGSDV